jgi:hypothetical protein
MLPPVAPEIVAAQHSVRPLDGKTLANLAKCFADSIPEGEFSVAALQGCACLLPCYVVPSACRPSAYLPVAVLHPPFFYLRLHSNFFNITMLHHDTPL